MAEMENKDRAAEQAKQRREAAKRDAQILAEAEAIRQNTQRMSLAREMAGQMASHSKELSDAFQAIASGGIQYPKMQEEKAEQNLPPEGE